jgi:hypothetical protein
MYDRILSGVSHSCFGSTQGEAHKQSSAAKMCVSAGRVAEHMQNDIAVYILPCPAMRVEAGFGISANMPWMQPLAGLRRSNPLKRA